MSTTAPPGAPPWPGPQGPFTAVIGYLRNISLEARRYINAWRVRLGKEPINIYADDQAFLYW
ncbi:MAG TPA: hypothetical protein VKS03_10090, partial [Thermoanaerobaculia bacterium]|nr:hypothetical protein [Thermoanaerobaculia bacterium]